MTVIFGQMLHFRIGMALDTTTLSALAAKKRVIAPLGRWLPILEIAIHLFRITHAYTSAGP